MARKPTRAEIYGALLVQLRAKGADQDHFLDQVYDYMALYDLKKKLILDIKKRGAVYEEPCSTGVILKKTNPSNKELVMVNKQMLLILEKLGLNTDAPGVGDDDEL